MMLLEWINNYKKQFHSIQKDIHTTKSLDLYKLQDSTIEFVFKRLETQDPYQIPGRILLITLAFTTNKEHPLIE